MKKLGRNTFAVGMATLLVTSAVSLSANAAEGFETAAEARFLAGTEGLGLVVDPISRQIEGVEAICDLAALTADECPVVDEQNDIDIPIGEPTGLALGAVDNFSLAGEDGTSRAASGVVGDNGFIDTDYDGPDGSVTLDLSEEQLAPISELLADVDLTLGAVSAQAEYEAGDDDATRDYNIASAELTASLPILTEINANIPEQLEALDLDALAGTEVLSIQALAAAFPDELSAIAALLGGVSEELIDVEIAFPSIEDLTTEVGNFSGNGITIDVGSETELTVDLVALLESQGLNINELDPETDLLQFLLPALSDALDSIVADLFDTIIDEIVNGSSITVSVGGILGETIPPVVLEASELNALLDPLREGLETGLQTLDVQALDPLLAELLDEAALGQVLQVLVNNPDLKDQTLVEGEEPMEGAVFSQTAVRLLVGGGTAADIQLANAVVGPANVVDLDDDDAVAGDDNDGAAAGDGTDGAIADADTDGVDGGVGDGGGQGDADVVTSLPNAGAPNLLPFWLLGAGLIAFGGAVLLNERRRTALI